ncbi:MAG: hypothetical protein V2A74_08115, partial [bacterium]
AEPLPFSGATTATLAGAIILSSPNNSSNYFGQWASPNNLIPYTAGKVYRANWVLSTDQTQPASVPSVRFRLSAGADNICVSSLQVNPGLTASNEPAVAPATTIYAQYFQPVDLAVLQSDPSVSGLKANFDIIDFSTNQSGALTLDSVTFEALDPPTLSTSDVSVTTINASEWNFSGGATLFPSWQSASGTGFGTESFQIGVLDTQDNVVGMLSTESADSPPSVFPTQGQLYKATFGLSVGASDDRSNEPRVRLRILDSNFEMSSSYDIMSRQGGLAMPNTTTTNYDVYMVGGNDSSSPRLDAGVDVIAFGLGEAGTINVDQLDIVHGNQP